MHHTTHEARPIRTEDGMNTVIINNASNPDLETAVIESLRSVYDPEIPINIYDLGLIYEVRIDPDDRVHITMTLTTPNCPVAGILPRQIEWAVQATEGVTDASIELTFDPPFTPDMMSEEAKLELGFL
ncbi:MAG: SUF system Fe-S cluster assembly protein [Rhodothermales bacterium]